MRTKILLLILFVMILASCSDSRRNAKSSSFFPPATATASVPKPTDDGLLFANAIVIIETSEDAGVSVKYSPNQTAL